MQSVRAVRIWRLLLWWRLLKLIEAAHHVGQAVPQLRIVGYLLLLLLLMAHGSRVTMRSSVHISIVSAGWALLSLLRRLL